MRFARAARRHGSTMVLACLAAGVAGSGCSSSIAVRDESVAAPRSAASWSGVFGAPQHAATIASADASDVSSRRDAFLGVGEPSRFEATNQWPQEPRPTLRQRRTISFPAREQSYIFFFPDREHDRRPHRR